MLFDTVELRFVSQHDNILAHWGPPGNQLFVTFDPRDPQNPAGGGRDGRTMGRRGVGVGGSIYVHVYMQLQAPGSRLRTPNGAFKIGPKAYH